MYYVDFGMGYGMEKAHASMDKTRASAISFMKIREIAPLTDFRPTKCDVYKAKKKSAYVGKIVYKDKRFWWVTYGAIQELSENGKVKKLMTYIPL